MKSFLFLLALLMVAMLSFFGIICWGASQLKLDRFDRRSAFYLLMVSAHGFLWGMALLVALSGW